MSKNGLDASGAAARALLRLSEAPSTATTSLPSETAASSSKALAVGSARIDDEEAPDAIEELPPQRLLGGDARAIMCG